MGSNRSDFTNTRNTPVEASEQAYPMRVLRYSIRQGGGEAGLRRAATGSSATSRRWRTAPCRWSPSGGYRARGGWRAGSRERWGRTGWLIRQSDGGRAEPLPAKVTVDVRAGDVIRVVTPGGGGWGAMSVE